MAEEKKDTGRRDNSFIARAVADPAKPQPLGNITGYRGASSEAGYTRLYLDANVSSYVDIPEGDVLYELPVPAESDPLGAVTLWIKADSQLKFQSSQAPSQGKGETPMFTQATPQGAAPQSFPTTGFPTQTLPTRTFTPPSPALFCHQPSPFLCPPSPFHNCPPPSPFPWCVQPTPSILQPQCQPSPLPWCVGPASPNCTPVQTPFSPVTPISPQTTPQTTFDTGSFAGGGGFGGGGFAGGGFAEQQAFGAAPQAGSVFGPVQQIPTLGINSQVIQCAQVQSVFIQCFSQQFQCHTINLHQCRTFSIQQCQTWICPVSPWCPPQTPFTPVTTPQTTPQTTFASFAGGGGGFAQAMGGGDAFGAAPQAGTPAVQINPHLTNTIVAQSNFVLCQPSIFIQQCITHQHCPSVQFACTPASPFCTPLTFTHTPPTTPVTTPQTSVVGPFAQQFAQQGQADPQAFTISPITIPSPQTTIPTIPTPQSLPTFSGGGGGQGGTFPTVTRTFPTVTQTFPTVTRTFPTVTRTFPTVSIHF